MYGSQNKSSVDTKRVRNVKKTDLSFFAIISGIIFAVIIGSIIRATTEKWSQHSLMYLSFPGEIILQMLKCLIIPLVISSLVSALGNLRTRISIRLGGRALIYCLFTTLLAAFTGIILTLIIRPGKTVHLLNLGNEFEMINDFNSGVIILDMIKNMFPVNLIQACFAQYSTSIKAQKNEQNLTDWTIEGKYHNSGSNILGLAVFSTVLGIVLSNMKTKGKSLLNIFETINEVTLRISNIVMKLVPIGVMFLVLSRIISVYDMQVLFREMGLFALTVLIGLFIHGFIFLPATYFILTKNNPYILMFQTSEALATALGTGSSLATLPVTISCLENKANLNKNLVRLCAPIGSVINMDGTALYETVAAIFIAQAYGIDIGFWKFILLIITATIASMGTAGMAQAGLMAMALVLNAIGVPLAQSLSLVIGIDWILDRFRTTVNVMSDVYGSAIVQHFSKDDFKCINDELDSENIRIKLQFQGVMA